MSLMRINILFLFGLFALIGGLATDFLWLAWTCEAAGLSFSYGLSQLSSLFFQYPSLFLFGFVIFFLIGFGVSFALMVLMRSLMRLRILFLFALIVGGLVADFLSVVWVSWETGYSIIYELSESIRFLFQYPLLFFFNFGIIFLIGFGISFGIPFFLSLLKSAGGGGESHYKPIEDDRASLWAAGEMQRRMKRDEHDRFERFEWERHHENDRFEPPRWQQDKDKDN